LENKSNKNNKRKKIIEVSTKLFVEKGFHGTPTSLIAKKSDIATGTLFNYFKTKDILINDIYKEIKTEQKKMLLEGLEEEKNSKGKLEKIWNNLIEWGLNNPCKRKFIEYFSNSYYISEDTRTEVGTHYKFVVEIFKGISEKKKLKNTDDYILIFNFIGMCNHTLKYFYLLKKPEEKDGVYDKKISKESFERFCKSIDLDEND